MTSLIFGATSSPFVLATTLRHHLHSVSNQFPLAAQAANHFYVDDLVTATSSVAEAELLHNQLVESLNLCSMNLRKWRSSDSNLDQSWNQHEQLKDETSVLGLGWNVRRDLLSIKPVKQLAALTTKRQFLAQLSAVFDPLGMISFASVHAKRFLQSLCQLKID